MTVRKKILLNKTQSDYFPDKLNKACKYWALALQQKILRKGQYLYWLKTAPPSSLFLHAMAERALELSSLWLLPLIPRDS